MSLMRTSAPALISSRVARVTCLKWLSSKDFIFDFTAVYSKMIMSGVRPSRSRWFTIFFNCFLKKSKLSSTSSSTSIWVSCGFESTSGRLEFWSGAFSIGLDVGIGSAGLISRRSVEILREEVFWEDFSIEGLRRELRFGEEEDFFAALGEPDLDLRRFGVGERCFLLLSSLLFVFRRSGLLDLFLLNLEWFAPILEDPFSFASSDLLLVVVTTLFDFATGDGDRERFSTGGLTILLERTFDSSCSSSSDEWMRVRSFVAPRRLWIDGTSSFSPVMTRLSPPPRTILKFP